MCYIININEELTLNYRNNNAVFLTMFAHKLDL